MKYWSIGVGMIICAVLLPGCNGWWIQKPKVSQSIPVIIEGSFSSSPTLLGDRYAIRVSDDLSIALEKTDALSLSEIAADQVVAQAIFSPSFGEAASSLFFTEVRPLSFQWRTQFFPLLEGSMMIPVFLETHESEDRIIFIKNGSEVARFTKKTLQATQSPSDSKYTQITIGTKNAYRSIQNSMVTVIVPEDSMEVIIPSSKEDLSLWYSIIESYMPDNNTKPNTAAIKTDQKPADTLLPFLENLVKNCASVLQEACEVRKIGINRQWIDIEFINHKEERIRAVISSADSKRLASYRYTDFVWKLISGNLPDTVSLFSLSSLSIRPIVFLPEEMEWLVHDTGGFQIAYPKKMYYSSEETQAGLNTLWWKTLPVGPHATTLSESWIRLQWNPKKIASREDIREKHRIRLPFSATAHAVLESSEDIPFEILEKMADTMLVYQ